MTHVAAKVARARIAAHIAKLDICEGCGKEIDVVDESGVVQMIQFCAECEAYDPESGHA